ncbi:FtsH protease activity modulator HflK [Candidatus Kinetoplastidibacterium crithidiae]|uniref:Protein HflK n=1 Tax=Candidatus Kinetoplastidibacterium crithidiae TCC036E TaxID=1208918 RepID=M1LPU8_9PROT|nr:membrane protease subunit HflK [Candidatus Kinetoplastibacterium crithidii TCC036E]
MLVIQWGKILRIFNIFNFDDSNWGRGKNKGFSDESKKNSNPPDLDDVWNDLSKRFSNIFGKYGKKNSNDKLPDFNFKNSGIFFCLFILFASIIWLSSSFFVVKEGQVSVITRFGKYYRTAQPGFRWHLPYPIENHEMVNLSHLRTFEVGFRGNSQNKVLSESLMLTTDENIVDMQFVVQYRLSANGAINYLFKIRDPDESVKQAAETAMREIVGKKNMDFVLYEGRTAVTFEVQKLMQNILNNYNTGIQITAVAIQNVQPPEQVQAAFDDAVKAGQDRERKINEGYAYANQVIPLASGQSSRYLEQAEAYKATVIGEAKGESSRFYSILKEYEKAPDVTRTRLYLEAMESIFSKANKLMIDSKNNNVLLLPIDALNNKINDSFITKKNDLLEEKVEKKLYDIDNSNDSFKTINKSSDKIKRDRSLY